MWIFFSFLFISHLTDLLFLAFPTGLLSSKLLKKSLEKNNPNRACSRAAAFVPSARWRQWHLPLPEPPQRPQPTPLITWTIVISSVPAKISIPSSQSTLALWSSEPHPTTPLAPCFSIPTRPSINPSPLSPSSNPLPTPPSCCGTA